MSDITVTVAEWLEAQPWCPTDTVYTLSPPDPARGTEPLTLTVAGLAGNQSYLLAERFGRIQLVARGIDAISALDTCYTSMEGVEVELASGTWATFAALQSVPNVLRVEDEGGEYATINFTIDYGN